jgi:hypothetical protein
MPVVFFIFLSFYWSVYWASVCARTAVDALFWID